MISLIQMEYIVAVDTYRHFVTAANKCFVTQPTLSMQIKKMEEDLGVQLFNRSVQPVQPTPVGEKVIAQARVVLAEAERLRYIVEQDSQTVSGSLTLGVIPSIAPYLLPRFIGTFRRNYPEVHIKIVELLTEDILHQLKVGQIDLGLLVTPLHDAVIDEHPLFYEEMLLYVNSSHPYAWLKEVAPALLAGPDLWLLEDGHCFRTQVVNLCGYHDHAEGEGHFEYASGSLETIKKMVEREGGYTLLPELAIDEHHSEGVIKSFGGTPPVREVSLVHARTFVKEHLLEALISEIKAAVPVKMLQKERGNIVEWRQIDKV